ncbi:Tetratricopeptide repeat protein [Sulfidibacter corallicola]|uniref:Tetratricopeptide repeat protein n=1 Tax=Sulfidibacter corallicola TaxID=2818388 RepID=A0A8A4TKM1_SULCO|nr:tetratricopeptide repeat protein [Sulfidibacter corallicola]QTD49378.1 tetratricopeptide repeat protein [Sulfidibacter corallicola]
MTLVRPYRNAIAVQIDQMYRDCRYLDAYRATQPYWSRPSLAARLTVEELVLAARLAAKLGGSRESRILLREARKRSPQHPQVRFFGSDGEPSGEPPLNQLRDFVEDPDFGSEDPALDARWVAQHAQIFARYRDFESSTFWMTRARELNPVCPWLDLHQAHIWMEAGRWDDALPLVEAVYARQPGCTSAAHALIICYGYFNKLPKAAGLLLQWIQAGGQSLEILQLGLIYALHALERNSGGQVREQLLPLVQLARRLPHYAPLADRTTRRRNHAIQAELAKQLGDHGSLAFHAKHARSEHVDDLLAALKEKAKGRRILLKHPVIRQKHNTCMPASLATCLQTLGLKIDQDELARKLAYDGTNPWRVKRWAEENGLCFRPFLAHRDTFLQLLKRGIPSVATFVHPGMGHACTAVGFDTTTDSLLYHDPSGDFLGDIPLKSYLDQNGPIGPLCFAVIPEEMSNRVRDVVWHQARAAERLIEFWCHHEKGALAKCREIAEAAKSCDPESPLTRYQSVLCRQMAGHWSETRHQVRDLLETHPRSTSLQMLYLGTLQHDRNPTAYRAALRAIVEGLRLPELEAEVTIFPHTQFHAALAQQLAHSAKHQPSAARVIERGLRLQPHQADLCFALGQWLMRTQRNREALLPLRLAATLHLENDVFARGYAWACHKLGEKERALGFLAQRAEHLCAEAGGAGPWIEYIRAAEAFGRPDQALEILESSLERRPEDGTLWAFASGFLMQYGKREGAKRAWNATRRLATEEERLETGTLLHAHTGDHQRGLETAERWVALNPNHLGARRALIQFVGLTQGPDAAAALPARWHREQPEHRMLAQLYLEQLTESAATREDRLRLIEHLNERLAEQPGDDWALQVRAWTWFHLWQASSRADRADQEARLDAAVTEALHADPDHPNLTELQGAIALERGEPALAEQHLTRLLAHDPNNYAAFSHLYQIYASRDGGEREALLATIERAFYAAPHHFEPAEMVSLWMCELFGFPKAEAQVRRWLDTRPDDPMLAHAWINLHLREGAGLESLRRVKPTLQRMMDQHPQHTSFKLTLADFYLSGGKIDKALALYRHLTERNPSDTKMRASYAELLVKKGHLDDALVQWRKVVRLDPFAFDGYRATARIHLQRDQTMEALDVARKGAERIVHDLSAWEMVLDLLCQLNRTQEAEQLARELPDRVNDRAMGLMLLAETLKREQLAGQFDEVKAAYAAVLEQRPNHWPAIYEMVNCHCVERQFDSARDLLRQVKRRNPTQTLVEPMLALVDRVEGHNDRALDAMRRHLERTPADIWAWQLAVQWTREDNALEVGNDLLLYLNEDLFENVELGLIKLELEEILGFPAPRLVESWERLAKRFPSSEDLQRHRFDFCFRNGLARHAANALTDLAASIAPDDAEILIRHTQLACLEGNQDVLVDRLLAIGAPDVRISEDRLEYLFDQIDEHFLLRPALARVLEKVEAGTEVSPGFVGAVIGFSGSQNWWGVLAQVGRLLEPIARKEPWQYYLAMVLDALSDEHGPQIVLAWREANPDLRPETSVLWSVVSCAYMRMGQWDNLCIWLDAWQDCGDFPLSAQVEYLVGLRGLGLWHEIEPRARAILQSQPSDRSAAHTVVILMSALLVRGQDQAFLFEFLTWGSLVEQASEPWYSVLACFAALLDTQRVRDPNALNARFRLAAQEILEPQNPLRQVWRECMKRRLSLGRRITWSLTRKLA